MQPGTSVASCKLSKRQRDWGNPRAIRMGNMDWGNPRVICMENRNRLSLSFPWRGWEAHTFYMRKKIKFSVPASLHHATLVHLKDGDSIMEEKCKTRKYVQTGDSHELKEASCCCTPFSSKTQSHRVAEVGKPEGHQVAKTNQIIAFEPNRPLATGGKKTLPAGGWFREKGAEESPGVELEFPFPTRPYLCQPSSAQNHISLKKCSIKDIPRWLSLHSCRLYHEKAESSSFHQPLNLEQRNPVFLHNDPEVILSRLSTLTWNHKIQITFQCKYKLR